MCNVLGRPPNEIDPHKTQMNRSLKRALTSNSLKQIIVHVKTQQENAGEKLKIHYFLGDWSTFSTNARTPNTAQTKGRKKN